MTSLYRTLQLQFITLFIVVSAAVFFTYDFTKSIYKEQSHIQHQPETLDLAASARYGPYKKSISQDLQKVRAYTTDPAHAEVISNFIQAYNSDNKQSLDKRYTELIESEKNLFHKAQLIIKQNIDYLFAVVIGAVLVNLLNAFVYLRFMKKQIIKPIDLLGKKINDFVDGSYSYRFTTPAYNEIGNLDSSFRSMAEEVLKNIDELKALDQAKSEFMNIVSHELRTPMTSIKGSLGLIASGRMGELPEKAKSLVAIAEAESNRLIRLTNDFLDLAKIESRNYSLQKSWFLLDSVIDESITSLHGLQEKAAVHIEVSNIPSVEVFVDKDKIQQILVNLLSNAMKFTPENGTVYVVAEVLENKVYVRIRDQGPGISNTNQQKIFQKFRQVTSPERPLVKGTGLGLSIAKALVEAHEGKIGLTSEVGVGSEFYFTLKDFREFTQAKEALAA